MTTEQVTTRWVPDELNHEPETVTRFRIRAGYNKRGLAAAIGVAESLIGEIERGTRNASPPVMAKLAQAFGCTVEDLERKPIPPCEDLEDAEDVAVPLCDDLQDVAVPS